MEPVCPSVPGRHRGEGVVRMCVLSLLLLLLLLYGTRRRDMGGDERVTIPGQEDVEGGRAEEEVEEAWIYRMTQQLLSPVFSRFL